MVIMWINNGKPVLSQRSAPSEVMPTVVSSPPRIATLLDSQTTVSTLDVRLIARPYLRPQISTTKPSLAYTIPVSVLHLFQNLTLTMDAVEQ